MCLLSAWCLLGWPGKAARLLALLQWYGGGGDTSIQKGQQIRFETQAEFGLELISWRYQRLFCESLGFVAGMAATRMPLGADRVQP